jgi:hypothetical protein
MKYFLYALPLSLSLSLSLLWGETESTWYIGYQLACCTSPKL